MSGEPDPKPQKPIRDPQARRRKLASDSRCRCCRLPATDAHHIIYRKQGDDVEDNFVPLCHKHHMMYHNGTSGYVHLTDAETDYVFEKLGEDAAKEYFERRRLVPVRRYRGHEMSKGT